MITKIVGLIKFGIIDVGYIDESTNVIEKGIFAVISIIVDPVGIACDVGINLFNKPFSILFACKSYQVLFL